MRARVLLYVQHLLGVGHLTRAAAIAKAAAAKGLDVLLVSGGLPHPDLDIGTARLFQLPPLRAQNTSYTTLIDENDQPIGETFKSARRQKLLDRVQQFEPHLVMTEHFPFGRGKLRFELDPLLGALRSQDPKPLLFASVRDIIEPAESNPKRQRFLDTANAHYDAILIHGDEGFAPFDLSFPDAAHLRPALHYTGYVGTTPPIPLAPLAPKHHDNRVLISAGHGRTGGPLAETTLAAHRLDNLGMQWEVRIGQGFPANLARRLHEGALPGLTLTPAKAHFAQDLAAAALSVSQAGYNTVTDLALSGTPSVLVPYTGHDAREQTLRAARLARSGHAIVMEEKSLSPETLLAAMTQALQKPDALEPPFRLEGATQTANLIQKAISNTGRYPRKHITP